MKINKLNYENYVIDYIEGTLSIDLKKDFDQFLEKNKDVYDEIKEYMSAPIYEETEEIFKNKKAIRQSNNIGKIALLTLIPLLFLGIYFISNSKEEQKASSVEKSENLAVEADTKVEETKVIQEEQNLGENRIESKKIANKEKLAEKKKVTKKKTEAKVPKRQTKEMIQPTVAPMQFAAATVPTQQIEPKVIETKKFEKEAVASRELISAPISIGNLELKFDVPGQTIVSSKMAFAEVSNSNQDLEIQQKKKSAWLEMITPAAFEDLNLKESLAVQSSRDIDTKKILNAFIPESIVK